MKIANIAKKIKKLPQNPGVYIFKDNSGKIIYIGKATNLKSRVSSYFRSYRGSDRPIEMMMAAFLIRETLHARLAIGLAMVPRGEVGLIFAELGRVSGIFSTEIYAAMVIVIALTTLLPPFVMKWFYGRYASQLAARPAGRRRARA